jgi:signal transduction histidine kinase
MRIFLIFVTVFTFAFKSSAQTIQLSDIKKDWLAIMSNVKVVFNNKDTVPLNNKTFNDKNFKTPHFLLFTIQNNTAFEDSVNLFVGQWFHFDLSKLSGNSFTPLVVEPFKTRTLLEPLPIGKIILKPNEIITVKVAPKTQFFNYNYFNPTLIKQAALSGFIYHFYYETHKPYVIISLLFTGLMIAIFIYATFSLILQKTPDYFYYGLYSLFFLIFFIIRIYFLAVTDYAIIKHSFYIIHFIQVIGYVFYGYFIIDFIGLRKTNDILYKVLSFFTYIAFSFVVIDYILIYHFNYVEISMQLFSGFRIILIFVSAFSCINLLKRKSFMSNYIAIGVGTLCLFGAMSLLFSSKSTSINRPLYNSFYDIRITLYQIGIAIELILFTIALQYKLIRKSNDTVKNMEMLRLKNERESFENKMALLEIRDRERNRIAQEIHDDMGSGLTNIRLLSEIALTKLATNNKSEKEMHKISEVASELVENMNEIIWSINAKNDNLKNLVAYLRRFVANYFEDYDQIEIALDVANIEQSIEISGDLRRCCFLTTKEALHNIIKHANATKVQFQVLLLNNTDLNIVITDNGIGIDMSKVNELGNGLKNISDRVKIFNGKVFIHNNNGTIIHIKIPLTTK